MKLTYSSFALLLTSNLLFGTVACGGSTGGGSSGGGSETGGSGTGGSSDGSCIVEGKTYEDGTSFPIECNECACHGGAVECTTIACNETCGGFAGGGCGDGEFCLYDEEASCGAGDGAGSCHALPNACTDEYAPVCGCDGKNYSNSCQANAMGVNVASEGDCPPPP